MKNSLKKIIILNLIFLIIVYFIIDIICFVNNINYNRRFDVYSSPLTFIQTYFRTYKRFFYTKSNYDYYFIDDNKFFVFREALNLDSPKQPVLIMGCSFAWGNYLMNEQTFGGKIVKYTDRPVFNRGIWSRGLSEMLYQVRTKEFYDFIPKPEWFIYVFIPDQIRRTQVPCSVVDTGVYYDKNLNIKHDISFPLYYTIKNHFFSYDQKYIDFSVSILKEIKAELTRHWGDDIKYLFLYYNNDDWILEQIKPQLEQDGFIIYSLNDLTDIDLLTSEYKVEDQLHPSESAWEIITPALVEKTKM